MMWPSCGHDAAMMWPSCSHHAAMMRQGIIHEAAIHAPNSINGANVVAASTALALLFLGRGCMGWEVSGMHGQHECINHAVHRLLHGGKAQTRLSSPPAVQRGHLLHGDMCQVGTAYHAGCSHGFNTKPCVLLRDLIPSRPGTPPRGSGNSHRFMVAGRPTSSIPIAVTPCFLRNVCPPRPVSTNPGRLAGADVHHIRPMTCAF